jgi:hypothetical protein
LIALYNIQPGEITYEDALPMRIWPRLTSHDRSVWKLMAIT